MRLRREKSQFRDYNTCSSRETSWEANEKRIQTKTHKCLSVWFINLYTPTTDKLVELTQAIYYWDSLHHVIAIRVAKATKAWNPLMLYLPSFNFEPSKKNQTIQAKEGECQKRRSTASSKRTRDFTSYCIFATKLQNEDVISASVYNSLDPRYITTGYPMKLPH